MAHIFLNYDTAFSTLDGNSDYFMEVGVLFEMLRQSMSGRFLIFSQPTNQWVAITHNKNKWEEDRNVHIA